MDKDRDGKESDLNAILKNEKDMHTHLLAISLLGRGIRSNGYNLPISRYKINIFWLLESTETKRKREIKREREIRNERERERGGR